MFDDRHGLVVEASRVPLQQLSLSWAREAGIDLWIRRDDLIHPALSGNKFYKLYFNLQQAKAQGVGHIASYGGAWSNHLHALAAAGAEAGLKTHGVVRGEAPAQLSACLVDAESWGMELRFVSRELYKLKPDNSTLLGLPDGDLFWVPEGGANLAGAAGMQVLGQVLEAQLEGRPADICLACGTASSLAGVAAGVSSGRKVLGFPVLKSGGAQQEPLAQRTMAFWRQLQSGRQANWCLLWGFHGGGYGRKPKNNLFEFWRQFEGETGVPLDPVYTLKLFWGIYCLARLGYWPRGSRVIAIHTGGLQGRRGFTCP